MNTKAAHVRAHRADSPGSHTCHWPGCKVKVAPALWGCGRHWFKLPARLRNLIWKTYRPGQEQDKKPSPEYVEAAQQVQAWIAENSRGKP